jgi:hypothetical protein
VSLTNLIRHQVEQSVCFIYQIYATLI